MKQGSRLSQSGFASIMFAIFMAMVLCLLAIGFAFISRNDQRQTLDKTLSNQATYAAESAINKIQSLYQADSTITENPSKCSTPTGPDSDFRQKMNTASGGAVSITCLRWQSSLPELVYDPVDVNPVVVPIFPSGNSTSIKIVWQSDSVSATSMCGSPSQLDLGGSNCIPTLKIAAASNRYINKVGVIYLSPFNSGDNSASVNYGSSSSGSIAATRCISGICNTTLSLGWSEGYISIASLNGKSKVTISAAAAGVNLTKAQVQVDATAKSQDVIKRLIAYVPLIKTTWHPGFVASAETLCKNYKLDGDTNADAGPIDDTPCPED